MPRQPDPFDPAQFAALWLRVAPEGSSCPVAPSLPPSRSSHAEAVFLSGCIRLELCRWKRFQALVRRGVPCRELAAGAYARARQLSAALFLRAGGHYFPARSLACSVRENTAACLRALYADSCRMEQRYQDAASGAAEARLRTLYIALSENHSREQAAICALLERL